jgi:hypothetical protein
MDSVAGSCEYDNENSGTIKTGNFFTKLLTVNFAKTTSGSFLGVKRPGREADHSPPSSAEVKNAWSYTFSPQYTFMAWCLVKHRDYFTLLYFTYFYVRYAV